jgi:hypothetical protein
MRRGKASEESCHDWGVMRYCRYAQPLQETSAEQASGFSGIRLDAPMVAPVVLEAVPLVARANSQAVPTCRYPLASLNLALRRTARSQSPRNITEAHCLCIPHGNNRAQQ